MSPQDDHFDEDGQDELRVLEATRHELSQSIERTHELIVEARHTLASLRQSANFDAA